MMPLAGQPMIRHIVERARTCKRVDDVIVATSDVSSDNELAEFCLDSGISVFRGSLTNVLSRYVKIIASDPHDYVVRITGDCPLIDSSFIDKQIIALETFDGDYIGSERNASVLEGQGVLSSRSLMHAAKSSTHPDDLEHVGSRYMVEHPEQFRIIGLEPPKELTGLRWRITVDEAADLQMMQNLYSALWRGKPIPLLEALGWMASNPDIADNNRSIPHSVINQELAHKRTFLFQHIELFCDWNDPSKNIRRPLAGLA